MEPKSAPIPLLVLCGFSNPKIAGLREVETKTLNKEIKIARTLLIKYGFSFTPIKGNHQNKPVPPEGYTDRMQWW